MEAKWPVRLHHRITPREVRARTLYEASRARWDWELRQGRITPSKHDWRLSRALKSLEEASCGSPPYDRYVSRQRKQLEHRKEVAA